MLDPACGVLFVAREDMKKKNKKKRRNTQEKKKRTEEKEKAKQKFAFAPLVVGV